MTSIRVLLLSIFNGLVTTIGLTVIALSVNNKIVSGILLWQVTLLFYLVGPGPLLSYDERGNPQYEGTPIHMLVLPVGLLITFLTYSIASWIILRSLVRRQPSVGIK